MLTRQNHSWFTETEHLLQGRDSHFVMFHPFTRPLPILDGSLRDGGLAMVRRFADGTLPIIHPFPLFPFPFSPPLSSLAFRSKPATR